MLRKWLQQLDLNTDDRTRFSHYLAERIDPSDPEQALFLHDALADTIDEDILLLSASSSRPQKAT